MSLARVFFGIAVPELADRMPELRKRFGTGVLRFIPENNLHITLRFVGEVPREHLTDYIALGHRVSRTPFPVTIGGGLLALPRAQSWRTLCLPVQDCTGSLAELNRQLMGDESRAFLPHVTIARSPRLQSQPMQGSVEATTLLVTGFDLYESNLTPQGAEYRSLCHYLLE